MENRQSLFPQTLFNRTQSRLGGSTRPPDTANRWADSDLALEIHAHAHTHTKASPTPADINMGSLVCVGIRSYIPQKEEKRKPKPNLFEAYRCRGSTVFGQSNYEEMGGIFGRLSIPSSPFTFISLTI